MSRTIKTVTQATSKTTAVTKSGYRTRIVTVALTDAANGTFNFTYNNDKIEAHSFITLTPIYAGTNTGVPVVALVSQTDGSCVIRVTNVGGSALDAVLSINVRVDNAVN